MTDKYVLLNTSRNARVYLGVFPKLISWIFKTPRQISSSVYSYQHFFGTQVAVLTNHQSTSRTSRYSVPLMHSLPQPCCSEGRFIRRVDIHEKNGEYVDSPLIFLVWYSIFSYFATNCAISRWLYKTTIPCFFITKEAVFWTQTKRRTISQLKYKNIDCSKHFAREQANDIAVPTSPMIALW